MRCSSTLIAGALLATGASAASPLDSTGEVALTARLKGLVAGTPVSCVSARQLQGSDVIAGTAIVYETTGSRVYVNRPRENLAMLRGDRILITRSPSTQVCDADIVDLANRTDRLPDATVTLGQFVPYDKPRR